MGKIISQSTGSKRLRKRPSKSEAYSGKPDKPGIPDIPEELRNTFQSARPMRPIRPTGSIRTNGLVQHRKIAQVSRQDLIPPSPIVRILFFPGAVTVLVRRDERRVIFQGNYEDFVVTEVHVIEDHRIFVTIEMQRSRSEDGCIGRDAEYVIPPIAQDAVYRGVVSFEEQSLLGYIRIHALSTEKSLLHKSQYPHEKMSFPDVQEGC